MPVEFYYNSMSPSARSVWMALKELGMDFVPKHLNMVAGENRTPEYLAINPKGQIPAIKDGDFILTESRAIMAYLVNCYGDKCNKSSLYPRPPKERGIVDMVCYKDMELIQKIVQYLNLVGMFQRGENYRPEKIGELKEALKTYDSFVSKTKYMAGNQLTIADFCCLASISFLMISGFDLAEYANLTRWLKLLEDTLPYYQETTGKPTEELKAIVEAKRAELH